MYGPFQIGYTSIVRTKPENVAKTIEVIEINENYFKSLYRNTVYFIILNLKK